MSGADQDGSLGQQELFSASPPALKKRPAPQASLNPKWSKYNQKSAKRPHLCDFCMRNDQDAWNEIGHKWWNDAPIPKRARYRRACGGEILYLCAPHADDVRHADGLAKMKHKEENLAWR